MSHPGARLARVAACCAACGGGAAGLLACLSERPRPAPPVLSITLDKTTVHSPDTLTGAVGARDEDGLDSIWVSVDAVRTGEDGLLQTSFERPIRFAIRTGHAPGTRIPVQLEARDLTGFRSELDTIVTVVP